MIRPALLAAGFRLVALQHLEVTDDVSIIEAMHEPVQITTGSYSNIKVRSSLERCVALRTACCTLETFHAAVRLLDWTRCGLLHDQARANACSSFALIRVQAVIAASAARRLPRQMTFQLLSVCCQNGSPSLLLLPHKVTSWEVFEGVTRLSIQADSDSQGVGTRVASATTSS